MNDHLKHNAYFVGNNITIADISLYAYTHVANEGGFDLSHYTNIMRWFNEIETKPGYIKMARENA